MNLLITLGGSIVSNSVMIAGQIKKRMLQLLVVAAGLELVQLHVQHWLMPQAFANLQDSFGSSSINHSFLDFPE